MAGVQNLYTRRQNDLVMPLPVGIALSTSAWSPGQKQNLMSFAKTWQTGMSGHPIIPLFILTLRQTECCLVFTSSNLSRNKLYCFKGSNTVFLHFCKETTL